MNQLPSREIIIIGGGAVGCGAAYALARAGRTDILLIERADDVGQVTTSQGAGLCGQVRDSAARIKLAMHSVSVFRELQQSDVKPDWHEVGSLRIALTDKRAVEFQQLKKAADEAHLDAALIDNGEARRRWPGMEFSRAKAVIWCRSDGWMTPRSVAISYDQACGGLGVCFATSRRSEEMTVKRGRVW